MAENQAQVRQVQAPRPAHRVRPHQALHRRVQKAQNIMDMRNIPRKSLINITTLKLPRRFVS